MDKCIFNVCLQIAELYVDVAFVLISPDLDIVDGGMVKRPRPSPGNAQATFRAGRDRGPDGTSPAMDMP